MSKLNPPAPSITQRALVIRKAIEEISKIRAEQQVKDALNQQNGPSINAIHNLPLNSNILIWYKGNTG
jgi:carbamoylphosphate synthase small subunit